MKEQKWRKALWHLRHGGLDGFRRYREKVAEESTVEGTSQAVRSKHADGPELSVVVPAYNAASFIERCLNSILQQDGVNLEVIVVNDGSTDETDDVLSFEASCDKRVIVLDTENRGPAEARNQGVEAARGSFLAFADADDEVLPGAYRLMLDSLSRTGSDVATGSYVRHGATGRSRPKIATRVHARRRLAVRLEDMPELLEEPVLWNKVYRREFWNRHVGEMVSYANYEDQEPVYRAFIAAAGIDVLTEDVYLWRLADGRQTRSRRKGRLTDLRARLTVIEALSGTLEYEPEAVRDRAYAIWLGRDLAMHAQFLDTASKKFRKALAAAASRLKKTMSKSSWDLIPAQERLFMRVVATGRLDDIEEILGTRAEETTAVPLDQVDGTWFVAPTYVGRLETRIPRRLLRAKAVDFDPQVIIRNARWIDQYVIELQGCAYIPGIAPDDVDVRILGFMDGAVVADTPVESVSDNKIDLEVGDPWRSYAHGGFRARISVETLADISSRGIDLIGQFDIDGVQLRVPAQSAAVVGMIAPSPIARVNRVTVVADSHDELSIRPVDLPDRPILAKSVSTQGRNVTATLTGSADVDGLELRSGAERIPMRAQGPAIYTGSLSELPEQLHKGGERTWSIIARTDRDQVDPVYHEAVDYLLPDTSCVRSSANVEGEVRLDQRYKRVSVTGAASDRDRLLVTGRIDPPEKLSVVLRSSDQTIAPDETTLHADGTFTAVYDLTTEGAEGGTVAAMAGGYHVRFGSSADQAEGWARVAGTLAIRPVDCFTEWNTIRLEGRSSGAVAVTASPPWSTQERTKVGSFALRDRDWGPLTDGIVFESYNGKSANDNPRALFDAIREEDSAIPLYWSVRDRRVDVPDGGIPVVEGTTEWHRVLATSRVWINNNNFPYYVRKLSGQFYLQTWHGTPIKKLLWDIPQRRVPLTYRRLMRNEVRQWDLLLVQSKDAEQDLRTGLGYPGQTELVEYPRNLRLAKGPIVQNSLRHRLGIDDNERVILYVPTWREADRYGGDSAWPDLIDLHALSEQTDSTVLVRYHHMTRFREANRHQVIDVSEEPFVEDFMTLADLLITDYSSIAVDFSLTGKPVIHHVPDLSSYAEERGFYDRWSNTVARAVKDHRSLVELANQLLESSPLNGPAIPQEIRAASSVEKLRNMILAKHDTQTKMEPVDNKSNAQALLPHREGNSQ